MKGKRLMVVTREQYSAGYLERKGFVAFSRSFSLVRRLQDGNDLVVDPVQPAADTPPLSRSDSTTRG